MFTAEEARKLAKEVKDKKQILAKQEQESKKQKVLEKAEPIINNILQDIKQAIEDEKEGLDVDVMGLDNLIIDFVILKLKELGYNIEYVDYKNPPECKGLDKKEICISWNRKEEKMIYVKTGKDEDHEKVVSDLIKSLKKDKQYFEHKPVYWFHEKFPTEFFL